MHPDKLTFGTSIAASALAAAAQATPGVEWVEVVTLRRLLEPHDKGKDKSKQVPKSGVLRIGPLEVAQLDDSPASPGAGRLSFEFNPEVKP